MEFINEAQLWPTIALVILLSSLVHGLSAGAVVEQTDDRAERDLEAG